MSQSDAHRNLVLQIKSEIELRYPRVSVIADIQENLGGPLPPLIDGFRPDVYATMPDDFTSIILAEAKTDGDLENPHTDSQLSAFVNYLERRKNGTLILAVTGRKADRAKTLLRFMRHANNVVNTTLAVFDGCDFWMMDSNSGVMWHLS